jgi:hypothetical protein
MKSKIYSILAGLLLTVSTFAQAPQKMSYQAVIRNSSDALIASTPVGMKISVLQGSASGTAVYAETQTPSTNANGLVSLEIGAGTPVTGTFAGINWATGPYFIKTETDPTGGTNYSIVGTNQLMSVPYALFSGNAYLGGFSHYLGELYNGGVVFSLYRGTDGLEHGLIVSLTESPTGLKWQTISALVNANRFEDGAYNTPLMTGSPAATYIASLGSGWFLPSSTELFLLGQNAYHVQKTLRNGGYTLLGSTYWSSYEIGATDAVLFDVSRCTGGTVPKAAIVGVRGVKAF